MRYRKYIWLIFLFLMGACGLYSEELPKPIQDIINARNTINEYEVLLRPNLFTDMGLPYIDEDYIMELRKVSYNCFQTGESIYDAISGDLVFSYYYNGIIQSLSPDSYIVSQQYMPKIKILIAIVRSRIEKSNTLLIYEYTTLGLKMIFKEKPSKYAFVFLLNDNLMLEGRSPLPHKEVNRFFEIRPMDNITSEGRRISIGSKFHYYDLQAISGNLLYYKSVVRSHVFGCRANYYDGIIDISGKSAKIITADEIGSRLFAVTSDGKIVYSLVKAPVDENTINVRLFQTNITTPKPSRIFIADFDCPIRSELQISLDAEMMPLIWIYGRAAGNRLLLQANQMMIDTKVFRPLLRKMFMRSYGYLNNELHPYGPDMPDEDPWGQPGFFSVASLTPERTVVAICNQFIVWNNVMMTIENEKSITPFYELPGGYSQIVADPCTGNTYYCSRTKLGMIDRNGDNFIWQNLNNFYIYHMYFDVPKLTVKVVVLLCGSLYVETVSSIINGTITCREPISAVNVGTLTGNFRYIGRIDDFQYVYSDGNDRIIGSKLFIVEKRKGIREIAVVKENWITVGTLRDIGIAVLYWDWVEDERAYKLYLEKITTIDSVKSKRVVLYKRGPDDRTQALACLATFMSGMSVYREDKLVIISDEKGAFLYDYPIDIQLECPFFQLAKEWGAGAIILKRGKPYHLPHKVKVQMDVFKNGVEELKELVRGAQ